jgi:hypothetical protein
MPHRYGLISDFVRLRQQESMICAAFDSRYNVKIARLRFLSFQHHFSQCESVLPL